MVSTHATAENAEAISNAVDQARNHLMQVQKELARALALARNDYPHNADKLEQIVGTVGLLTSAVNVDYYQWNEYARVRRVGL